MSKNIRNTSDACVLNFNASAGSTGATGPIGPSGINATYSLSAVLSVTYDPSNLLFGPTASTLQCERVGNMLFVKILSTIVATPFGNSILYSNVGVIPVGYRPSTNQIANALVVDGYVDGLAILQVLPPYNTPRGVAKLDTAGTLTFGSGKSLAGAIQYDGVTLTNFSGPNAVGLLAQTLIFSI